MIHSKVLGSIASGSVPAAVPANGARPTTGLVANTDGRWQIHDVISIHHPQALNDRGACHADGWAPKAVVGAREWP